MYAELPGEIFTPKELVELRLIDVLQVPVLRARSDGEPTIEDGTLVIVNERYCVITEVRDQSVISAELSIPGIHTTDEAAVHGYRFEAPPIQNATKGSWNVYEVKANGDREDVVLTEQLVDLLEAVVKEGCVVDLEADSVSRKLDKKLERRKKISKFRQQCAPSALFPAFAYVEAWQRERRRQLMVGIVAVHAKLHTPVEPRDSLR